MTGDKSLQNVWLRRGWKEAEKRHLTSVRMTLLSREREQMLDRQEGHDTKWRFIANGPDKIIMLAVYLPLTTKEKMTCAGTGPLLSKGWGEENLRFFPEEALVVGSSSWANQYTEQQAGELLVQNTCLLNQKHGSFAVTSLNWTWWL